MPQWTRLCARKNDYRYIPSKTVNLVNEDLWLHIKDPVKFNLDDVTTVLDELVKINFSN